MATQSQTNDGLGYYTPNTGPLLQQSGSGDGLGYVNPTTPYQNTPAPNAGPTESGTTPGQTGQPGLFSGIGSGLSSLLSGQNLGDLALYGGLYSLIGSQAKSAADENSALAGQISGIGQPAVNESQNLLGAYSSGQLTNPFQSQLTAALQANQNTAQTEQSQSAQLLANASSGNIQSAVGAQSQQIQNAKTQADTQAVSNAFTSELSASNGLLSAGGSYVQAGIVQNIQSNTQLQNQLAQLMGALAQAYAQSQAGTAAQQKPSTGTGTSAGSGGAGKPAAGGTGAGGGTGFTPGDYSNLPSEPGTGLPSLPDYTGQIGAGNPSGTVIAPGVGDQLPSYGQDPSTGLPYETPGQIGYVAPNFGSYGGGSPTNYGGDWQNYGG